MTDDVRLSPFPLLADPVGAPSGGGEETRRPCGFVTAFPLSHSFTGVCAGVFFMFFPHLSCLFPRRPHPLFVFRFPRSVLQAARPFFISCSGGFSAVFVFMFRFSGRFASCIFVLRFVGRLAFFVFPVRFDDFSAVFRSVFSRRSYSKANTKKGGRPLCSFAPSRHPPSALSG